MQPCHSCYRYGTWSSKELGRIKVMVWRRAKGVSHKVKEAICIRNLIPQVLSYLPISASFGLKRVI